MTILKVLIEAFRYFIIRLRTLFIFIPIFIFYCLVYVTGKKVGRGIMKTKTGEWINKRFKK